MQPGTETGSEIWSQLILRGFYERLAKLATQLAPRFQLVTALGALLQMRDDPVILSELQR